MTSFSNGFALLVGVGADLPVSVKDATAIYNVLVDASRAAYPPNQVELLTETRASRQNILKALDRLIERTKYNPDATVVVYFSGHGMQITLPETSPKYFLLPNDYNPNQLWKTTISGKEFTEKIEAIHAHKLVILLDCCHAAGIPSLKEPREVSVKSVPLPPDLLNILKAGRGRVIVASSLENEFSYTGTPYSIFTSCLLEGLGGKAAVKKDGFARILDILIYLIDQVPDRAPGPQHPFINKILNLSDNFPLSYYAGGSKEIPGEAPSPMSVSALGGSTVAKRSRLEARGKELRRIWDIREERMQRIQETLAIETDPSTIFKYEKQLLRENVALMQLSDELDEIEQLYNNLGLG